MSRWVDTLLKDVETIHKISLVLSQELLKADTELVAILIMYVGTERPDD